MTHKIIYELSISQIRDAIEVIKCDLWADAPDYEEDQEGADLAVRKSMILDDIDSLLSEYQELS